MTALAMVVGVVLAAMPLWQACLWFAGAIAVVAWLSLWWDGAKRKRAAERQHDMGQVNRLVADEVDRRLEAEKRAWMDAQEAREEDD